MSGPIKTATIGGVKYNANLFDAKDLGNGKYQLTSKKTKEIMIFPQQSTTRDYEDDRNYYYNGRKLDPNETFNGKKVSQMSDEELYNYGVETTCRTPKISLDIDEGMIWDDAYYTISQVDGLEFKSSKESVSHVQLEDCNDGQIDLSANNSRHYGDSATISGGSGNEVIMDDQDTAQIEREGKVHPAYTRGAGTAAQDDYK